MSARLSPPASAAPVTVTTPASSAASATLVVPAGASPAAAALASPGTPALQIRDLRKAFVAPDGERTAVVDIPSFSLFRGAQVALRGASGSGKTTLLHLIAGILQPDAGQILIAGRDMTAIGEARRDRLRAETMGYVFQTFNLLQGYTALENVMLGMLFGRGVDAAFAVSLLERVGMSHRLTYRPRQLSVGQQQRVAVARALANRPILVLADEPTGNLDRVHAREALALIRGVCAEQEAALLLVSHDPDVLGGFDRVVDLAELNRAAATTAHGHASAGGGQSADPPSIPAGVR